MPTFEEIREKYAQKQEEYEIRLSGGEVLKARTMPDASAMVALGKHTDAMQKMLAEAPTPEYAPYLPVDPVIVRLAVMMEVMLVEPKVSTVQALDLAKNCGLIFSEIGNALEKNAAGQVARATIEALEREKKG